MLYSIGKTAKILGVTPNTLRTWDRNGTFKPDKVTESGTRYYSEQQINKYMNRPVSESKPKIVIGYCRVSSAKQKDDLDRQVDNVKTFMIAKGYSFEIVTDIGSGINYNKRGLHILIDKVMQGGVDKIVVLYKDRLLRFGYELLEYVCEKYGTEIIVIDNTEKTEQEELVEDLIQIITVFSCRLQGKRAKHTKDLIEQIKRGDTNDEVC